MAGLGDLIGKLLGKSGENEGDSQRLQTQADTLSAVNDSIQKSGIDDKTGLRLPETITGLNEDVAYVKKAVNGDVSLTEVDKYKDAREKVREGTDGIIESVMAVLSGNTAKMQLEALIGQDIPDSATTTNAVMDQLALLTLTNEAIQGISIAGEIASAGQVDRLGTELRSYLDYSGVSQISGFGYGQILGTVIGARMSQEMLAITRPSIPSALDMSIMRMREIITPDDYADGMARLGYPDDTADGLYDAAQYYPGPQDWVRFAVRDVFNPAVVKSAGLDEQFPEDIVPLAAKGGVSEEHMRMHWRAHWNLPSPNQAYEMLHRSLITEEELRQLLKAADYAPGYIEPMVSIASTPYTRVDARRMFDIGILDDAQFIRAMMDIGYDAEKAGNLLLFAKSGKGAAGKDLSQSQMLKAYGLGKVPRPDLISYLMDLGYDATEAALLIDLEDAKKAEALLKEVISVLDWYYERGDITDAEYLDAVGQEGIPREKAEYYLSRAALDAEKSIKLPTKSDVEKWYKKEYITAGDALRYLRQMGYHEAESSLYMKEWTDEIQAKGSESNA